MVSFRQLRIRVIALMVAVLVMTVIVLYYGFKADSFWDALSTSEPYGPWLLIALIVDFILVLTLFAFANELTSGRTAAGEPVRDEGQRHLEEDIVESSNKYRKQV